MEGLTETEVCIMNVWKKVLRVDDVKPEQSFFDLGGDSLLMIDMLFEVNKALGTELDPGILFEEASLRGFARLVDAARLNTGTSQEGTI